MRGKRDCFNCQNQPFKLDIDRIEYCNAKNGSNRSWRTELPAGSLLNILSKVPHIPDHFEVTVLYITSYVKARNFFSK